MGALDLAIQEKRAEAAEVRKESWKAHQAIRMKPAREWARKAPIEARGGHRRLLKKLVELCGPIKANGGTRWYCEPRLASVAKQLKISKRTIIYQMKALEAEGLILRFDMPGRKHVPGKSARCCYLAVAGELVTKKLAEKDGYCTSEPVGEPSVRGATRGATVAPPLKEVLRTSIYNNQPNSGHGETAGEPVEATQTTPEPVPVQPPEPVLREYQPLEPVHNPDLRAKLNDLYAQIAEIEERLSENTEPRRDFYVIEGGAGV